ncbi:hypothetical protein CH330_06620 [candidate division WOR-3 bacterium JGI_Cruoil_03_51_56]|uniref:Metallo-beta-lactamase domain-containing protein n=1 Tax=candidate division WOR-3 bacterium JGI_Cruoil_03_51_56 TaxID=1973747 RepID=A0A235BSA2_UNCW3|nr:MAG: hypothetical protein CH330_06620 [candidate division WOR-3 bacterium JGI_Cruoil_03_51_56]
MKLTDPVIGGQKIQVEYIAFDSFGVKSMCTRIKTPDVIITIDPGASIESASFTIPEPIRRKLLAKYLEAYRNSSASSKAIVISHYHLDHFLPSRDPEVYGDKIIFAKSLDDLPQKQKTRAKRFHESINGLPEQIIWADNRRFKFKRTEIGFSKPVWHGRVRADPGTVIMTEIKRGREKVLITSDVSGPTEPETTDLICASKAQTIILDGYPTYHLGQFATDFDLVKSIINICRILAMRSLKILVIDHHMARDYRYPAFFKLAYQKAGKLRKKFGTAAEILGKTSQVIQGYQDYGPTKWHRWVPLDQDQAQKILEHAIAHGKTEPNWLKQFDRWVV